MPAGRPKFIIDYDQVEKLASIMCTMEEIATMLGCSHDTLSRDKEFCVVFKRGLQYGKCSLRRKQFLLADTNPAMAIFLGKNYLDQSDRREVENIVNVKVPMLNEVKQTFENMRMLNKAEVIDIDIAEQTTEDKE
jgi:hypothetical protein